MFLIAVGADCFVEGVLLLIHQFVLSALDFNEADKQVVRSNLVARLRRELPCKNQIEFAQKSATEQKLSHWTIKATTK